MKMKVVSVIIYEEDEKQKGYISFSPWSMMKLRLDLIFFAMEYDEAR